MMTSLSLDLISARPSPHCRHQGTLAAGRWLVPCALGRSGIAVTKREGDGATPAGTWPLRHVLYRPDRVVRPLTGLPIFGLAVDDGWCDSPDDPCYNRPVKLPYSASAEALWRDDHLYDLVVVIGYNDDPPVAGRGSAIFLHLATDDFGPTAGCLAVGRADMLRLLPCLGPGTVVQIGA